jgi:programmed cell death protein 5
MSGTDDYSDEELELLRRRRMAEMQRAAVDDQRRAQAQQQVERQKQAVIRRILTPEARQRLTNIRMVKPEFAEELEMQLIQLAQSGRLQSQVTDEQLKRTLVQLQGQRKDIKIRRA